MIALYIIMIILAAAAVIALLPVSISVLLNMEERKITLHYAFLSFNIYPRDAKTEKKQKKRSKGETEHEEEQDNAFDIGSLLGLLNDSRDDIKAVISKSARYLSRHGVIIRELNISSVFGTDDPAYTGILCGAAYTAVYNAVGYLDRNTRLKKWSVELTPDFEKAVFSAGIYVRLSTNAAHSVIMLCMIIKYIFRIGKRYIKTKRPDTRKEQDNG